MAIPKDILAVARPKSTFVVAYGKDKDRYAVRKYVGCRYDKGRHIPIKGPTVGHIVGGRFVESDDIARRLLEPAFYGSEQAYGADAYTDVNKEKHASAFVIYSR